MYWWLLHLFLCYAYLMCFRNCLWRLFPKGLSVFSWVVRVCACVCLCVITLLLNHLFLHLSNQWSVSLFFFSSREGHWSSGFASHSLQCSQSSLTPPLVSHCCSLTQQHKQHFGNHMHGESGIDYSMQPWKNDSHVHAQTKIQTYINTD